jgi:hypothetical protein
MGGDMREGWAYSNERAFGGYWHHATLPVFVVHYVTGEHYQGYKAIERTLDSVKYRWVGDAHGFETLDQAMAACEAAAGVR